MGLVVSVAGEFGGRLMDETDKLSKEEDRMESRFRDGDYAHVDPDERMADRWERRRYG